MLAHFQMLPNHKINVQKQNKNNLWFPQCFGSVCSYASQMNHLSHPSLISLDVEIAITPFFDFTRCRNIYITAYWCRILQTLNKPVLTRWITWTKEEKGGSMSKSHGTFLFPISYFLQLSSFPEYLPPWGRLRYLLSVNFSVFLLLD